MPSWLTTLRAGVANGSWRAFSTRSRRSVPVRCGSEGCVTVDLYDVAEHLPSAALVVHLPSFPPPGDAAAQLPAFLQGWPVASINYRWETMLNDGAERDSGSPRPLGWPIPVHDTAFAFRWIVENLAPPNNGRRDIYVYGSHLGAGLATSLSLTETRPHARFGVRGLMAYNGIYNWTMFLPDHRINQTKKSKTTALSRPAQTAHIFALQESLKRLFEEPSNLFDPFISPSLFFHNPGLLVPRSFYITTREASMIEAMVTSSDILAQLSKPPRKSHLVFPPRKSTLKTPEALLLHDSPPSQSSTGKVTRRARPAGGSHTFEAQASELAGLMRRSIDMLELVERQKWDVDIENWTGMSHRRVQTVDVGAERNSPELSEAGQDIVLAWLRDRTQKPYHY